VMPCCIVGPAGSLIPLVSLQLNSLRSRSLQFKERSLFDKDGEGTGVAPLLGLFRLLRLRQAERWCRRTV